MDGSGSSADERRVGVHMQPRRAGLTCGVPGLHVRGEGGAEFRAVRAEPGGVQAPGCPGLGQPRGKHLVRWVSTAMPPESRDPGRGRPSRRGPAASRLSRPGASGGREAPR